MSDLRAILARSRALAGLVDSGSFVVSRRTQNLTIRVFGRHAGYFVKVGCASVRHEYAFVEAVHPELPDLLPRPVELVSAPGCDPALQFAAVYAYARTTPLTYRTALGHARWAVDAIVSIERFFAGGRSGFPRTAQHGDFAFNNLGVRGNRLTVFDWEDVGTVTAPGFDFSVFMASVFDFDAATLRRDYLHARTGRARAALDYYAGTVGKPAQEIAERLPAHLEMFLQIKRGRQYGAGIIGRLEGVPDALRAG